VRECFGSIIGGSKECEPVIYRFRRRDDGWAHLEVVASTLVERPLHGIILNARDVSERVKTEARIKELNELRSKFIEIVSHQLRTPLTAIRWNLEAMLSGDMGRLTDAQAEFLRVTYEADVEIIDRIHDLLTAMDIEEGRVVFTRSASSLEGLWGSVLLNWKKQCALKQIDCAYASPDESLPMLDVDADKIRYVLEKLMQNAVMYTPSNGRIQARIRRSGDSLRFEIADSGIGIPKHEQPRIFARFFRASNASTVQPDASGLGLSIARYFIERHGGSIGFTSSEGTGTTFWFELPVARRAT
jgi:signal transduction histidine kinase